MKSIVITKFGGPEVLKVLDSADLVPQKNEVRIRTKMAGLNFAEIMARKGLYPDAPKTPCVVGYEVSGIIDAVGSGVKTLKSGDRVAAMVRFGAHADTVIAHEKQVFPIPNEVSFETAAALPVNYLTAYEMLFRVRRIKSGDHVLIHAAAGGVGTAVLQFCKTIPNITTYGTASKSKHDYIRTQGCTHPIDYRTEDYVEKILKITNGKGVDLVMGALGGKDWKKGYSILKPFGLLIPFGWSNMSAGSEKRNLFKILKEVLHLPIYTPVGFMNQNRGVAGVNMGHLWNHIEMLATDMNEIVSLVKAGKITPHIDRVFKFKDVAEAHRYVESGKNIGKVLLAP